MTGNFENALHSTIQSKDTLALNRTSDEPSRPRGGQDTKRNKQVTSIDPLTAGIIVAFFGNLRPASVPSTLV
jgi:hypothetical protein